MFTGFRWGFSWLRRLWFRGASFQQFLNNFNHLWFSTELQNSVKLHVFLYSSRKEISQIMKSSYLRGLNMASFFASSKIIVFVTFTVYVLLGNTITASTVFVTVSLYGTIKLTVTLFFPLAVERLSETVVSIRRIKVRFLVPLLCQSCFKLSKWEFIQVHRWTLIQWFSCNLSWTLLYISQMFSLHRVLETAAMGLCQNPNNLYW